MNTPNTEIIPQPVTKTEGFNYRALLARVVIIGLLGGSVGLIWWSYYRELYPHLRQRRDLRVTVTKLSADVDALTHRWTPDEIEQINRKAANFQTNLFFDRVELQAWMAGFREQFTPMGLDVKSEFGGSLLQSNAEPKFFIVPTTVSVQVPPFGISGKGPSPYQRLLQLTQRLTARENVGCLTELTVESGPVSIDRAVLGFTYWTGTNESK